MFALLGGFVYLLFLYAICAMLRVAARADRLMQSPPLEQPELGLKHAS